MFERQARAYDARLVEEGDARVAEARGTTVEVGDVPRREEMRGNWERGAGELEKLKMGLGGTVARMEKASQAVGVLQER